VIYIKKEPINISISLIVSLNLLEENKEYNINEIKTLKNLGHHWITINKYLKIFNFINKYCPKLELNGSRLRIIYSKIYHRLSEKEKFILYLYNNQAFDEKSAVDFIKDLNLEQIEESLNYLFKKTQNSRFYLTESGINKYRLIEQNLSDLIYNEKEINEIFGKPELLLPKFKKFIPDVIFNMDTLNFEKALIPSTLIVESTTSSNKITYQKTYDLTEKLDISQL